MRAILHHRPIVADVSHDGAELSETRIFGEPRWPMAGAVLAVIALTVLLPDSLRLGPVWLLPVCEALLLAALLASDPGRITRRTRTLRTLSIGLVLVLALGALISTALLIDELISGGATTNEASVLLASGVKVWVTNALAFALLFWELDSSGPAARAHSMPRYPDFAFPQTMQRHLAPANWRPRFADFLYVSVTNSLAFSPTDTMPLAIWAKLGMGLQSLISFAIMGLVIARAVNVFE